MSPNRYTVALRSSKIARRLRVQRVKIAKLWNCHASHAQNRNMPLTAAQRGQQNRVTIAFRLRESTRRPILWNAPRRETAIQLRFTHRKSQDALGFSASGLQNGRTVARRIPKSARRLRLWRKWKTKPCDCCASLARINETP